MIVFDKYLRLIMPDEVPKYHKAGVKIHQSQRGKYYAIIEPGTKPLRSLKSSGLKSGNTINDIIVDMIINSFDDDFIGMFFDSLEMVESKKINDIDELSNLSFNILKGISALNVKNVIDDELFDDFVNNYFEYIKEQYGEKYSAKLKVEILDKYFGILNEKVGKIDDFEDNKFILDNKRMYAKIFYDNNIKINNDIFYKYFDNLERIKRININEYNKIEEFLNDFIKEDKKSFVSKIKSLVDFLGYVDIVDDDDAKLEDSIFKGDVFNNNISDYIGKNIEIEYDDSKCVVDVVNILHKLFGECYIGEVRVGEVHKDDVFNIISSILKYGRDDLFCGSDYGDYKTVGYIHSDVIEALIFSRYDFNEVRSKYRELFNRQICLSRDDFIELNKSIGCYDESASRHYSIEWETIIGDFINNELINVNINGKYYPMDIDESLTDDSADLNFGLEVAIGFLKGIDSAEKIAKMLNVGKVNGMMQNTSCGMHIHIEADDIIDKFYSMENLDRLKVVAILSNIVDKINQIGYISSGRYIHDYAMYDEHYRDLMETIFEYEKDNQGYDFFEYFERMYIYSDCSVLDWIEGGKYYSIKFDIDKKTLEYRLFENVDNSPIKFKLNVELAHKLNDYISEMFKGDIDDKFKEVYENDINLKDVIGEELYNKITKYAKERNLRMKYISDISSKIAVKRAKVVGDFKNEIDDKKIITFEPNKETGELYRIEIDEKGNKKIYNEFGEIINRGD